MTPGTAYELTDHACRHCGSRVLRAGDTFRCGSCGAVGVGNSACVCGCGIHPSLGPNRAGRFRCVANPERGPASPAEIVIEFYSEPGPVTSAVPPAPAARPVRKAA